MLIRLFRDPISQSIHHFWLSLFIFVWKLHRDSWDAASLVKGQQIYFVTLSVPS